MFEKKAQIVGITLALSLAGQLAYSPVKAASTTPAEIEANIKRAKILADGIGVKAAIQNELAYVTTFRMKKANDDDSKIEAVLIAKTVIDSAPEVTRVMVYFYNRTDHSRYKQVVVTAGDVKAFASGQLDQKALLSSIAIGEGTTNDVSQVAGYIESAKQTGSSGGISIAFNGTDADVSAYLPSEDETDCRLEALRLAERTLGARPGIQRVKVMFFNPAPDQKGIYRQIVLDANTITSLNKSLDGLLTPLQVTVAKLQVGIAEMAAVAGPLQAERQAVLDRLKALERKGVGIGGFLNAFQTMEGKVSAGDEAAIRSELTRVTNAVAESEKANKALKERPVGTAAVASAPSPAEGNPKYLQVLLYFAQVLRQNNRPQEAKEFESKAYGVMQRHPEIPRTPAGKLNRYVIGRGSPINENEVLLDPIARLHEAEAVLMSTPR